MKQSKQILAITALAVCLDCFAGGTPADPGMVIFDMTANPGNVAIDVNLYLSAPSGSKGDTAIDDGYGGNAINIDDFQVIWRDVFEDPDEMNVSVGISAETVIENKFGNQETQNTQFANDGHLFDLDRLRKIADWMSSGTSAINTALLPGTYGTISYAQFLSNIVNNRTMYGVVRVLLPLELGKCTDNSDNCNRNALGQYVTRTSLYGLCTSTTGACACAPKAAKDQDIAVGNSICGNNIAQVAAPNNKKIRVKGSLLWDFVASAANPAAGLKQYDPIPLRLLPWAPRELYFKVIIPILVNWEHDLDEDGAMDNMLYIKSVSKNAVEGDVLATKLDYSKVPASSKVDYQYYTGLELTQVLFDTLDVPTQYHLMMPNGYAPAWEAAFQKLGITGAEWTSIPGINPPLGLPRGVTGTISANHVRNPQFEDIPAYLYTGGLIDMHDQVNISGLVYVPQGMELEAKNGNTASPRPTRQYVIGAIVVRDTFYIEAKDTTVTVISSDPTTYSSALLSDTASLASQRREFAFGGSVAGDPGEEDIEGDGGGDDNSPPPGGGPCYTGCDSEGGGDGMTSSRPPGASRWIEVRPQPQ